MADVCSIALTTLEPAAVQTSVNSEQEYSLENALMLHPASAERMGDMTMVTNASYVETS